MTVRITVELEGDAGLLPLVHRLSSVREMIEQGAVSGRFRPDSHAAGYFNVEDIGPSIREKAARERAEDR